MRHKSQQSGSALLTVLWLTAALSAIGLAVANNVRSETERAATSVDDVKAYFIARGAIERTLLRMRWGQDYYTPFTVAMDLDFPNAQTRVEIIPETSKLGLNSTRPEELLALLVALGVSEDRAIEIASAIVDWRSPATRERPSPFDSFYLAQVPSFQPRHTSFLENEELLLVKGVTPDLFYGTSLDNTRAGLRDCLSAFSSSGGLDVNTARAETMMAVGVSPQDAASIVRGRAEHPVRDYQQLAGIQQSLGPAGGRLRMGGNSMFTLRSTVQLKLPDGRLSGMRRTVAALIKRFDPQNEQHKLPGFEVMRWYDRY